MELRQLNTFRAVAEALSFTRAAEALNYAQSSVTAQIHALESELGVPLFERLGKKVVLTEAGHRLLSYAKRILQLEAEARVEVPNEGEPVGTLTIGAPESLCAYRLPPVLSEFCSHFPKVQVIFRPGICADLRRMLHEGALDVAFLLEDSVQHAGLVVERLVSEPIRIVAHPEHPLSGREVVVPSDFEGETILQTEAGCTYRGMFARALAEAGVRPAVELEFSSVEAIKQCAMARMGVAALPEMVVGAEMEQGRLRTLAWSGGDFVVSTQVAYHKDKWLSPALSEFLAIARAKLSRKRALV